jgi:hypothetical protein
MVLKLSNVFDVMNGHSKVNGMSLSNGTWRNGRKVVFT